MLIAFWRFCYLFGISLSLVRSPSLYAVEPSARGLGPLRLDFKRHEVIMPDGIKLSGYLFKPPADKFDGLRPGVIMANSWILNEYQYFIQASHMAARGYVVFIYANRGFGTSEGKVSVAGEKEVADTSTILDWLLENSPADPDNLAMAGISYGAGIALLAAAHEPRLKTVVAINAWGSLEDSLYPQNTVNDLWLRLLIGSGEIFGRLSAEVRKAANDLLNNREIIRTRLWARKRSPEHYLREFNQHPPKILLVNSYRDALFPPGQILDFFHGFRGIKRLIVDEGIHSSSSTGGLFGLSNTAWTETHRWLDHWVLGTANGVENENPVWFQVKQNFETYPYYPVSRVYNGVFSSQNTPSINANGLSTLRYWGHKDSGASTGIPVLSDFAASHLHHPQYFNLRKFNRNYGVLFKGEALTEELKLRGSPKLRLHWQYQKMNTPLIAYLYRVDTRGRATLLTHSVYTERRFLPGPIQIELVFHTMAADIKAGEHLAYAIDSIDPSYPKLKDPFSVELLHSNAKPPVLSLPIVESAADRNESAD